MHIQLRIWSAGAVGEVPKVGEPFYDPIIGQFGVFNGRFANSEAIIEWGLASVVNKLGVPKGYRLGGFDSTGGFNNIQLDWSVPGHLRIIDANDSDRVLADHSAAGSVFANAASETSGLPGPRNRVINSGLSVQRSLIPNQALISTTSNARPNVGQRGIENESYWENPLLIAPNWFAWKAADSDGDLTFSIDTVDKPAPGVAASIKVVASGAPNNSGLTVYDYDYDTLGGQIIRPSMLFKGTINHLATVRIRSQVGGLLDEFPITGTGSWVKAQLNGLLLPDDGSKWLAFDVLHNPGYSTPAASTWRVAAPQITIGATPSAYEVRNAAYERAFAAAIWREMLINYDGITELVSNTHTLGFLPGVGTPMADYVANDSTVMNFPTISDGQFTIARDGGGRCSVQIAAHLVPGDSEIL